MFALTIKHRTNMHPVNLLSYCFHLPDSPLRTAGRPLFPSVSLSTPTTTVNELLSNKLFVLKLTNLIEI